MYKYVITWVLSTTVSIPCPDINEVDEFGQGSNYYISCSVFHSQTTHKKITKIFKDKDSAFDFYNRGVKQVNDYEVYGFYGLGSCITEIKIDSLKIK